MKMIKLLLALAIISSQTINAVWYNPFTWFSNADETETYQEEVYERNSCNRGNCCR